MKNKKILGTSIVSLMLCGALIVGASFAWFTDKVENTGNTISTGNLGFEVCLGDIATLDGDENYGESDDYTVVDAYYLGTEDNEFYSTDALIANENWEPGQSDAKYIQIKNSGTLAMDVNITLEATTDASDSLEDVIWFELYQAYVVEDGIKGLLVKGDLADIQDYLNENPRQLLPYEGNATTDVETYTEETAVIYILKYGMSTDAGNAYQNKTFSMDISFDAKQSVEEEDGFSSDQYDANAEFAGASVDALPTDGIIALSTDTTLSDELFTDTTGTGYTGAPYVRTFGDLVIDGNGNTLDMQGGCIVAGDGCTSITIKNVTLINTPNYSALVAANGLTDVDITLENVTFGSDTFAVFFVVPADDSVVTITDCTFTAKFDFNPDYYSDVDGNLVSFYNVTPASITVTGTTLNGADANYTYTKS